MKCSLLRLINQISVGSGKTYKGSFADELAKHNFPSAYWINAEALRKLDISVKPDQVDHGITLHKGVLYNASQTTNPAKIEALSGRLQPKFAISGSPMRMEEKILIPEKGENSWLTEPQVLALQLTVKPNSPSAKIDIDGKQIKCFAIDSIVESEKLKKVLAIQHFALATGMPYKGTMMMPLIKDTMEKNFSSGIWMTSARIEKLGAKLKPGQTPTVIHGEKSAELYNADQLEDKSAAVAQFEEKMSYQISGASGKNFPKHISDQLWAKVKENPSFSRYWLTKTQAYKDGGALQGEEPVEVNDNEKGGMMSYYNASQMKSFVMRKCLAAHKAYIKEKF
ncbi:mitochondrial RNA-binding protein RBP38 [Perkinsela sp. CCAP 1560/4]|nr:mitochondrial RNA-binding protein RBP38 [Perkinsela sp. CCAP 1560/4]|eukprot:KNH05564.1 mitochondrial RNA-binding protein RBP38 [Perkinsela sp. CCAP 1560/4]